MSKYIKLSLSALSILLSGTSQVSASNLTSQNGQYSPTPKDLEMAKDVDLLANYLWKSLNEPSNKKTLENFLEEATASHYIKNLVKNNILQRSEVKDSSSRVFEFMPKDFKEKILEERNALLKSTPNTPKKPSYDDQKAQELFHEIERRAKTSFKSKDQVFNEMTRESPKDNPQATSQSFLINGQTKLFTQKQVDLARQQIESSTPQKTVITAISPQKLIPVEENKNLNINKSAFLKAPKLPKLSEEDLIVANYYIEEINITYEPTSSMSKIAIFKNVIDNTGVVLTEVQKSYIEQQLNNSPKPSLTTPTKAQAEVKEKEEKVVKKPTSPDAELTVDFIKTIKSVPTPGGGNCGDLAVGMTRPTLLDGLQKVLKEGLPKGYNISQDTISKGIDNLLNKDDNSESIDSKILQLAAFGKDVLLRFIYEPTDEEKGYGMKRSEQDFMDFNTLFKIKPHLPILYVDVVEGGGHYQATSHFENMIETQEKMREAYLKTLPRLAQVQEDEMIKDAAAFYKKCNKTIEDCFPSNKR